MGLCVDATLIDFLEGGTDTYDSLVEWSWAFCTKCLSNFGGSTHCGGIHKNKCNTRTHVDMLHWVAALTVVETVGNFFFLLLLSNKVVKNSSVHPTSTHAFIYVTIHVSVHQSIHWMSIIHPLIHSFTYSPINHLSMHPSSLQPLFGNPSSIHYKFIHSYIHTFIVSSSTHPPSPSLHPSYGHPSSIHYTFSHPFMVWTSNHPSIVSSSIHQSIHPLPVHISIHHHIPPPIAQSSIIHPWYVHSSIHPPSPSLHLPHGFPSSIHCLNIQRSIRCLFICPYILPINPFSVHLFLHPPINLSLQPTHVHPSIWMWMWIHAFIHLTIYVSVHQSIPWMSDIHPLIHLFTYLSIEHISIHPSIPCTHIQPPFHCLLIQLSIHHSPSCIHLFHLLCMHPSIYQFIVGSYIHPPSPCPLYGHPSPFNYKFIHPSTVCSSIPSIHLLSVHISIHITITIPPPSAWSSIIHILYEHPTSVYSLFIHPYSPNIHPFFHSIIHLFSVHQFINPPIHPSPSSLHLFIPSNIISSVIHPSIIHPL